MILPRGWTIKPAQEICEKIQDGTHFSPKNQFSSGLYPYVTAKNVRPWGLDLDNLTYLEEKEHRPIYERSDTRKGDVLLVKDGVNAGDAAINTIEGEISLLSSVCFLRPKKILRSKFLRYYLQSPQCQAELLGNLSGSAIRRIILRKIRELPIIVAPLEEQDAIITELDIQLSRLDEAVTILQGIQSKLKQARASILKAAVEGRLVVTEAELARVNGIQFKSGGQLLAEISNIAKMVSSQKRNAATNKDATGYPGPIEIDGLALPMPSEGWAWSTMGDIASIVRNGYSGKPADQGPVKILRISAVRPLSVDHTDTRSLPGSISVYGNAIAREGCLLITRYNGNPSLVGVMGHYRSRDPVVHPDKLIRVELASPTIRPEWIEIAFNTGITRALLQKRVRTTAGQAGISGQDVKSMPVPVPPTEEQIRIIQEVQRRFSVLDQVEATVQTSLDGCGILRQAILKRAFE